MLNGVPGIVEVEPQLELSYEHSFYFVVPREYPQNLGRIKIVNETSLYHPRIGMAGSNACYTVNGEIDRILVDLIYNVLLRPETVRPPSLFKDADWGLNAQKMKWYIQSGPQKIYDHLRKEWNKRQKKAKNQEPGNKVQIIEG